SGPERYLSSFALITALIDHLDKDPDERTAVVVGRLIAHLVALRPMSLSIASPPSTRAARSSKRSATSCRRPRRSRFVAVRAKFCVASSHGAWGCVEPPHDKRCVRSAGVGCGALAAPPARLACRRSVWRARLARAPHPP